MTPRTTRDAIDAEVARVLYAQDPVAFVTHVFAIGLIAFLYHETASPASLLLGLGYYGVANLANLGLWYLYRSRPHAVAPRRWLVLHAVRGLLLYSAAGLTVWFAFASPDPDAPMLHTVLLMLLASGVYAGNGVDRLNFLCAMITLLSPALLLHLRSGGAAGYVLAVAIGVFLLAINSYTLRYRKLFTDTVLARFGQQELAESLAHEKRVAEEASQSKSRFFAAASHDLRQPLHAIGLLAESLRTMQDDPVRHAYVTRHIVNNVEALNTLFNQLLDLARIEAGVTQALPVHFRLQELFDRIDQQYRPVAASKGLALRFAPTKAIVHSDPILLERVIGNLLSNAIWYTPAGSVWIGYRYSGKATGGRIEVRDSGIGIPEEEQSLIFEEFYQITNPHRDRKQGHGLGLVTVQRLLQTLDSTLTLRSKPAQGSTFSFTLAAGDANQLTSGLVEICGHPAGFAGKRVLCIDDDTAVLEGLRQLLGQWGCQVVTVVDQHEAVGAIGDGFLPEAVICDFRLGGGHTGIQALAAVRAAIGGECAVPELLISGDMASPELKMAAQSGITLLHKPVLPARLRRALEMAWRAPV